MDYSKMKSSIDRAILKSPLDVAAYDDKFALCRDYEGTKVALSTFSNRTIIIFMIFSQRANWYRPMLIRRSSTFCTSPDSLRSCAVPLTHGR